MVSIATVYTLLRNDLNWFMRGGLFCLHDRYRTDGIRNYIFRRGRTSIVAIYPGWLCLVKICIYKKTFLTKNDMAQNQPVKNYHISLSYTTGHGASNDIKYSVIYSSHLGMVGTRIWCVISERAIFVEITSRRPYDMRNSNHGLLFQIKPECNQANMLVLTKNGK